MSLLSEIVSRAYSDNTPRIKAGAKFHSEYESTDEQIRNYLSSIQHLATEPGSLEWLMSRLSVTVNGVTHFSVGGSEIPTVIGENKHQKPIELLEIKANLITTGKPLRDTSADAVRAKWGHVVEAVQRSRCGNIFGTHFYDVPVSIPHPTHPNIRYTPDGLGPIILKTKGLYADEHIDENELVVALLELKNPFDRVVGDEIPAYYRPQLATGLEVVSIADIGLYVEANWKIKRLSELTSPGYNAVVHMRGTLNGKVGKERFDGLTVIDASVVIVSCLNEDPNQREISYIDEDLEEYDEWIVGLMMTPSSRGNIVNLGARLLDMGASSPDSFMTLMNLIEFYPDRIAHEHISLASDIGTIEEYNLQVRELITNRVEAIKHRGHHPFAIIPLGLYKEGIHLMYKTNFLEQHSEKIDKFIAALTRRVEELGGPVKK